MLRPSKLLSDYAIFHVLFALQKGGVFSILNRYPTGATIQDILAKGNFDEKALEAFFDFLSINIPEILKKENNKYILQDFFYDKNFQNTLFFALAYEPVLSCADSLLKRESIYGADVIRNGEYLGLSSALYNKKACDTLIELLYDMDINTIIDLGCNKGDFLLSIGDFFPKMNVIGVEIDSVVSVIAQKELTHKYPERSTLIINGDVSSPSVWRDFIPQKKNFRATMFVGITVWHEFLYKGEQYLLDIFLSYRKLFPGSVFVVVEYNGFSFSEFSSLPEYFRESASVYQLVHPLTLQGVPPSPSKWIELFKHAGMQLEKVVNVHPNTTIYITIL